MAALRDRIEFFLGASRDGTNVSIDLDVIDGADLVLVQRLFPTRATWSVLESILESEKPVVYETEDLLLDPDRTDPEYLRMRLCRPYIIDFLRNADAVTVATSALREEFSTYTQSVHVIPDLVHESLWTKPVRRPAGPVVLGFSGRPSDESNLELIEEALLDVHTRLRDQIGFVFIGCGTAKLARIPGARVLPEPPDYPVRARAVREAGIDIALAPLVDTSFNRCKGRLHWLEYSACGIAGIYADLPGYRESVTHGRTGLLVGPSPQEWAKAIEELVLDRELQISIARSAQQQVLSRHTIAAGASRLAQILEAVAHPPLGLHRERTRKCDTLTAREWLDLGERAPTPSSSDATLAGTEPHALPRQRRGWTEECPQT
jgi:glycosyltransferase involved in cell wall biosynthesis